MADLRDDLKTTLDEAEWAWLLPHHQRGALILVADELELLMVGEKIALDAKAEIEEWLKKGLLSHPSETQVEAWNKNPKKKFLSLIVRPWVLAQEDF